MAATQHASRQANRLIHEKSPYLLQHAYNPVDWYPWGEEAFEKARREDKPILLSIGYSTCHWCHVMAHESFENPEIAELMNRWFVCIKVDREEHPDVDQVYMSAVMRLTGQGGWPLTAFLTPDRKPFFGGTYFPPEHRWQMPGMREVLSSVAEAWRTRRGELTKTAEELTASLQEELAASATKGSVTPALFDGAFNQAVASFDAAHGGFGHAPKFPRSHELSFLLRYAARRGTAQAREVVETTLDHLARGGIHDHLGGGFHRYSTDAEWLVPHFEKMLYDQALLAITYLEAYRFTPPPGQVGGLTRREAYAETARGIFTYVLRDLTDAQGGFYAAEDADSEGEEGKFYAWTPQEMLQVLGDDEGALFQRVYGVTTEGNFEHGTTVLHLSRPLEEFAKLNGLELDRLTRRLAVSRQKLLEVRSRRVRPHRDDKILTSWNGLMIAAFADGASSLGEPRYLMAAQRAATFVLASLVRDGVLLRRYRDGEARYPGTLEDYAYFTNGLLELYQADLDPAWLSQAKRFADEMIRRFWDEQGGGFFLRGHDEAPLIVRAKDLYDDAMPSGNSMAVYVLARLGRLLADSRYEALSRRALEAFAPTLGQMPFGYPQMLSAAEIVLGPTQEIVIAGRPEDPAAQRMIREVHRRFLPRAALILHPTEQGKAAIEQLAPAVKSQEPIGGQPTAYCCQDGVCTLPTTSVEALSEWLDRVAQPVEPRGRPRGGIPSEPTTGGRGASRGMEGS